MKKKETAKKTKLSSEEQTTTRSGDAVDALAGRFGDLADKLVNGSSAVDNPDQRRARQTELGMSILSNPALNSEQKRFSEVQQYTIRFNRRSYGSLLSLRIRIYALTVVSFAHVFQFSLAFCKTPSFHLVQWHFQIQVHYFSFKVWTDRNYFS